MVDISIKKYLWMTMVLLPTNTIAQNEQAKSVFIKGMTLHWVFDKELLRCEVSAPTTGWVAVGFNVTDALSGTNLIMGAVEHDFATIDDRFIVKAGVHKSVLDLGGSASLMKRTGQEKGGRTAISFSIPLYVNDKYHHDLIESREYYVLLAYSQEDDFQHHSIMRTTIKIKL